MTILRDPENKTLYSRPIQIAEFKAAGDGEWEVSGYVSTFNNEDYGRDVVRPGAFKKTLVSGPKVRFLRDHDPRMLLGVPTKLNEDKKGLLGRFKISKTRLGEETHELLKDGALDSFSMSYHADNYEIDEKEDIRYLNEITLFEASLVAMPMNEEAVVTGFKDLLTFWQNPAVTMAAKIEVYNKGLKELVDEIRGLADKAHPLNEAKRKELTELLETFSGLDDVRSNIQSVLTVKPSGLVEVRRIKSQMAELRKRLPNLIEE